jgi:stage V sporulation protein G
MEITEVRIKLMESAEDRLRGFCSVTFDHAFVVRDLKIIEGHNGPFVAMPSRKLTANCNKCRTKNHLRAHYCNNCGQKLRVDGIQHDSGGRAKLYADIAHPINAACREMIQNRVIRELQSELELAKAPGYRSRYDEAYDDNHHSNANKNNNKANKSAKEETDSKEESDSKPEDKKKRQDQVHDAHSPSLKPKDQDVSSGRSKPLSGEFGQGIFD